MLILSKSTAIKTLLLLLITTQLTLASEPWAGRKLVTIVNELQAQGLPLLYSSQVVRDDLIIDQEPPAGLQIQRLSSTLQALGLSLQQLQPASAGYAIVRAPKIEAIPSQSADSQLQEILVYASRYQLTREPLQPTTLPQSLLEDSAGTEQDVLRNVQLLPGAASNSLSVLVHVRGGYEDENLYRFDGVELYKPVHLKNFQGLFGLLDPDWVQSLNFYSGGYPVEFGNHNAAVVDLAARQAAVNQYSVGASLLYSSVFGSGSYHDQAGHWLVGYRRSNLPTVLGNTETNLGEPEFDDLLLRHSYQLSHGELRLGVLRLDDHLSLQTNRIGQRARVDNHDNYVWLGWQQAVSESLSYRSQLTHTELSTRRQASTERVRINTGQLSEQRDTQLWTLDSSIDLQRTEHQRWQAGLRANHVNSRWYESAQATYLTPLSNSFGKSGQLQAVGIPANIGELRNLDYSTYLEVQQEYKNWRAELGLRYDVYAFLAYASRLSPRLNLQYELNPAAQLHVSVGRYVQVQALQTPEKLDARTTQLPPESMRQTIIGLTQALSPQLQLRIEAYDKRGTGLHTRDENLLSFMTLASELEIDYTSIDSKRSRAQGIELSLRSSTAASALASTADRYDWWLSYSGSKVQDQINGQYVRRSWDQPHAVTVGGNWSVKNWQLSSNAQWHSGWAYTPLRLSANQTQASLGARNSLRYQDYLSLALRANYQVQLNNMQLDLSIELRDVLNRKNECCREVAVSDTGVISVQTESATAIVPIIGLRLRF
jgi:outer membrane cobalamin receptor